MNGAVVVDASLATKWVVEESHSVEALSLLSQWSSHGTYVLAPIFLVFEIVNAIYKRVFRGQLTPEEARSALATMLRVNIRLNHNSGLHARALELASQFGRPSAYDAHYLALAEREGCELWTADERLWNAVKGQLSWVRWIGESSAVTSP
jgi:predicted nucleic acid-binding protein